MFYNDTDIISGEWNDTVINHPMTSNDNIGLQKTLYMYTQTVALDFPINPSNCYLDLHGMRNLCLISSALSNYDTNSNFNQDTIVKTSLLELMIMK